MSTGNSTSKSVPQACSKKRQTHPISSYCGSCLDMTKVSLHFAPGKSSPPSQEVYDSYFRSPPLFDHLLANQVQNSLKLSFLEKVSSVHTKET